MQVMASLILNTSTGTMPDHRNHDTLDNRRQNLRPATMEQNNQNRRIQKAKQVHFKGVVASQNKWRARIRANGKIFNLGTFPTPEDAHMAYVTAAQRLHGEFACFG